MADRLIFVPFTTCDPTPLFLTLLNMLISTVYDTSKILPR